MNKVIHQNELERDRWKIDQKNISISKMKQLMGVGGYT